MALLKSVEQADGVITTYHRIQLLQSVVNKHVSIGVLSYINEEGRRKEGAKSTPYKSATTYSTDYVENMTIEDAYNYLKTLPEFEGATDI